MAELMSQAEIDELLKGTVSSTDADTAIGGDELSTDMGSRQSQKAKTYSYPKKRELRFCFPYQSPVVKKEHYVLDPDPDFSAPDNTIVVRTLNNYVEYVRKKIDKVTV